MITRYNRVAGGSIERLAALSDGVFAVAMTLLVLDLHAPAAALIHSDRDLASALAELAPRLLIYMLSFLTLSIFWVGQQTALNQMARSSRDFAWLHLVYLFGITLMPFSTGLMAQFIALRVALLVYWLNILFLGVMLLAAWRHAVRHTLLRPEAAASELGVERRIIVAQSLYAAGAMLCVINTYWSIGFIVLIQLNYAFAPRVWLLWRL